MMLEFLIKRAFGILKNRRTQSTVTQSSIPLYTLYDIQRPAVDYRGASSS